MITGMTGQNMYDMVTALLQGQAMDQTLFLQLLAQEQSRVESMREWMILRKQDKSQTLSPSDNFQTVKSLPSDFFFWQTEKPVILVDPTNTNNFQDYLSEIPLSEMITYQTETYRFATDLVNNNIFFSGVASHTYTIWMNYIYKPSSITLTTTWVFPGQFHTYLPYAVAAAYKGGIDFDEINRAMAPQNEKMMQQILNSMFEWDDRLQNQATIGIDRGPINEIPWYGGRVPINR